jgi:hypothetical protein
MPSKTEKQAKFMRAVANSPKFAKKAGVPQSVGKEFQMKDKMMMGRGMGRGADMSAAGMARRPMKKGAAIPKMKSGGFVRSADGVAKKGKTRAKMC